MMATHQLVVTCSSSSVGAEIDEAQLLAETEELLKSLDPIAFVVNASDTQSSSSASDSNASGAVRARKRSPQTGNPSRERMKSELTALRKQVLVLENDLQNIHERQASSIGSRTATVAPMWERIAKRQLVACERAIGDNKRFKSMIKTQKELVVSMEKAISNWQHAATPDEPALLNTFAHSMEHKNLSLKPGDELLFAMLVSELDTTYSKVDDAFHEAGLDQMESIKPHMRATPKTLVAIDGRRRSFFELVEVETSPFDFETVNRAAKVCSEKASQSPDRVTFLGGWELENVVTEKHLLKRMYNGAEVFFHMLLAIKDFLFEDRMVSVWRCMFRCDAHFPDAYVQENGWFVTTNLPSSSQDDQQHQVPGSLSRMCVHLEPKRFTGPTVSIRADADTMTNLVMNSYYDDLQEITDMLENLLLEESVKHKTQSEVAANTP